MHEFKPRLWCDAVQLLVSPDGDVVRVRIEGVTCRGSNEPIYDVREVETGIGYPVFENQLKPLPKNMVAADHP